MSQTAPLVLVIEDEPAQMELICYNLKAQGFQVSEAASGEDGLMHLEEILPDLVILDWMLPGISGIEVCRQIKRQKHTRKVPVIMLTARGEEADRIRGLDTGADDYVVKPYSVNELIARVRALLRRTRPGSVGEVLVFGDLELDSAQHKVTRNGRPVKLGPTEYRLLTTFMESPKRVWSRDRLLDRVWGLDKDVDYRTVDVHIGRLRKALRQKDKPDPIRTVRGTGYSLDE
ncbi:MAG TPA: phosphate regulon transcriptional regulatory protein PhoB, partial [Rhizobiales bacterium]|nr:phosphate regulon transcriptional regulatory protein PhoB [Hyphomicrobiales bacterium]